MFDLTRFYRRAGCFLLSLTLALPAHANPEDDPLGALIQQKQAEGHRNDNRRTAEEDALSRVIRQKARTPQRPAAAPTPARPATNTTTAPAASNHRPTPAAQPTATRPAPSTPRAGNDADDLISSAMGFLGVAYRFGGTSPTGFDCSGFMQYIFRKAFAVNLPRTSAEQAMVGTPVNRGQLQPGDMVFFRTAGNRISHVGMYIGNDRFIHAPRTGKNIEITSLSSPYWSTRYVTARRVKRNNAQNFIRN